MTTPNQDPLIRLGALVRTEQAGELADERPLRRLEAAAETLGATAHGARRRRRWIAAWAAGGLAAAAGATALVTLWPRALSFQVDGAVSQPGMTLATDQQALPLRFSDGSVLTLAPKSEGEVVDVSSHGASVRLRSGRVEAAVVHAAGARWAVGVGPYVVQVTGTRFSASWDQARQRLLVSLNTGSVTVEGPLLGQSGLPLQPGQALAVDVNEQRVSLAPLAVDETPADGNRPAPALASPPETPEASAAPPASEWKQWALASDPRRAYAAARQVGIGALCRQLPPQDLLLLADTARFAGDPRAASQAFESLRARFPSDERAGDAVFGLGVLALDADQQPPLAAGRFAEYLDHWPEGALAREAQGRLMEALSKSARPEDARRVAARYLASHPHGPHATLARRLLSRERP